MWARASSPVLDQDLAIKSWKTHNSRWKTGVLARRDCPQQLPGVRVTIIAPDFRNGDCMIHTDPTSPVADCS